MISWPVEVADSSGSEPRRPVIIMRATERAAEELNVRAAMVGAEAARRREGRMEANVFILDKMNLMKKLEDWWALKLADTLGRPVAVRRRGRG